MIISEKAVRIATDTYYWKPMAAFFRSIEMSVYLDSKFTANGPILDLGCGDGGIIDMLQELGIVNEPAVGLEIDEIELKKANKRAIHSSLHLGSANDLPFSDESFSTIICNGVLCSIPEGTEKAINEAHRVLKKDGVFIVTVPTDKFIDVLLIPKLLNRLSSNMSEKYVKKLEMRLPHFNTHSIEDWVNLFESNNLKIEKITPFFTHRQARIWNIFTIRLFGIYSITKFLEKTILSKYLRKLMNSIFNLSFNRMHDTDASQEFGYVYIIAKKSE